MGEYDSSSWKEEKLVADLWVTQHVNLVANQVHRVNLNEGMNVALIRSPEGATVEIFCDLKDSLSTTLFDQRIGVGNRGIIVRTFTFTSVFLLATANVAGVELHLIRTDNPVVLLQNIIRVGQEISLIATGQVVKPGRNPTIFNISMPAANTEYAMTLPSRTVAFDLGIRTNDAILRFAFTSGRVAAPTAPWYQIPSGGSYYQQGLLLENVTLFVACPVAGMVAQVLVYTE